MVCNDNGMPWDPQIAPIIAYCTQCERSHGGTPHVLHHIYRYVGPPGFEYICPDHDPACTDCVTTWGMQMSELLPEHAHYATEVWDNTPSIEATLAGTNCTNGTNWYIIDHVAMRTKQHDWSWGCGPRLYWLRHHHHHGLGDEITPSMNWLGCLRMLEI